MKKCNMSNYNEGSFHECGKQARWVHPRWPDGLVCDEHKVLLENFFKTGWKKIRSVNNGDNNK